MSLDDDRWPRHGGQAAALLARFGLPHDQPLIDFSANLNPLGPPAWVPERLAELAAGLAHYPDPGYPRAREAIARHEGVAVEQVLLTNGGAEAIFLTAALHPGGRAAVLQPSFGEYTRACAAHGLAVSSLAMTAPDFRLDPEAVEARLGDCDLLFLCRPNNPTGTLSPWMAVETLLGMARRQNCRVVIDEAFIDFVDAPGERLSPLLAGFDNLILLRSLTKLYTLPGLRLGYVLAGEETMRRLQDHQPPWSVNHLAAELVEDLLADEDFLVRTQAWLREERPRFQSRLASLGLEVMPSQANFCLVRQNTGPAAADALLGRLLHAGILARHTHDFSGLDGSWLRLALRGRADNDRLFAALAAEISP
ncbi:threonine-phosphate decarboxylase CobD [Billgrantia endophytica]|uniref:threonine-phosphate decarboxylase CobD n=1 Tax=Billgrantia endophytica TaxID=2033802 RepID=UPI001F0C3265|nr:threonine-phosphate decarboxylase CobD [Halomonas endophytica]